MLHKYIALYKKSLSSKVCTDKEKAKILKVS